MSSEDEEDEQRMRNKKYCCGDFAQSEATLLSKCDMVRGNIGFLYSIYCYMFYGFCLFAFQTVAGTGLALILIVGTLTFIQPDVLCQALIKSSSTGSSIRKQESSEMKCYDEARVLIGARSAVSSYLNATSK